MSQPCPFLAMDLSNQEPPVGVAGVGFQAFSQRNAYAEKQ